MAELEQQGMSDHSFLRKKMKNFYNSCSAESLSHQSLRCVLSMIAQALNTLVMQFLAHNKKGHRATLLRNAVVFAQRIITYITWVRFLKKRNQRSDAMITSTLVTHALVTGASTISQRILILYRLQTIVTPGGCFHNVS